MPSTERVGVAEFYEREVLPALAARLDQAFPEFGWRRDQRGWVATNAEFTRSTLGVRPDRVVCHGDAPRGFLIHGEGAVLWTTYANDGRPARGREFVDIVRGVAERAGVDSTVLDRPPTAAERRAGLLEHAFEAARRELASERGEAGRGYLARRGVPADHLETTNLGVMPDANRLRSSLLAAGHSRAEIDASHLLDDARWPGRLVGAWRDERSRIGTLWARSLADDEQSRYLYLRGAIRPTIPYGLAEAAPADRRETFLVEGVLDVHTLRTNGVANVAAVGGASLGVDQLEDLCRVGVERLILAFDNDPAGSTAAERAIDHAVRARHAPDIWIIDSDLLGTAKDPGELVRRDGVSAFQAASAAPTCGITWRALTLTACLDRPDDEMTRRESLARASAWLGTLPSRLAIEQTAAVDVVAESLGYDARATQRAFRARYWRAEPTRDLPYAPAITR